MAAVLACGPGAVLSHRSAAALWGFLPGHLLPIDVTAPNRRGRGPKGIAAHRHGSLRPQDLTTAKGISCTSVARTLIDLAGVVELGQLRRAFAEAEFLRILDLEEVREVIKRNRGRRGVAGLRMLVDELDPLAKRARNELERRFLALCRRAGVPSPEVNANLEVAGRRVQPDFLWREERVIIETDGYEAHGTRSAFKADRRRDRKFILAGWRVSRCTWDEVFDEPEEVVDCLRGLLAK
jgi:very-short-patch-repair endonuclease